MRSRGWGRQWEKLGLKVTLTDLKTTEVDLDIAKDGGGSSITDAKTRSVREACFWQLWWKALSGSSYLSFTNSHMYARTHTTLSVLHTDTRSHTAEPTANHTHLQSYSQMSTKHAEPRRELCNHPLFLSQTQTTIHIPQTFNAYFCNPDEYASY